MNADVTVDGRSERNRKRLRSIALYQKVKLKQWTLVFLWNVNKISQLNCIVLFGNSNYLTISVTSLLYCDKVADVISKTLISVLNYNIRFLLHIGFSRRYSPQYRFKFVCYILAGDKLQQRYVVVITSHLSHNRRNVPTIAKLHPAIKASSFGIAVGLVSIPAHLLKCITFFFNAIQRFLHVLEWGSVSDDNGTACKIAAL